MDNLILGVEKSMRDPLWDRLTLEKITYSEGRYNVFYNYNPVESGVHGIYRMALVKKLPFSQVDFYENGVLVKTITQ